MGLFTKIKDCFIDHKTTTDIHFNTIEPSSCVTFENQDGVIEVNNKDDIIYYLNFMYQDKQQFATMTLKKPYYGVVYIQACIVKEGIEVQLGIQKEDHINLVRKVCTREECTQTFINLYKGTLDPDWSKYKPVSFIVD